MQRLKHPIRAIREPFGKAGLTVAILALVLAMVGGAYAAGGLTKSQEKQVKKIAKKYAGKPGAVGTNGTNGTNGAKGDPGVGTKGDPGEPGTSVTNTPLAKGEGGCPEGGAKFTVGTGTPTKACNGTTGFTETLPPGKTETGNWGTVIGKKVIFGVLGEGVAPISFNIPLASPLAAANIEIKPVGFEGTAADNCPGEAIEPKAKAGFLCVYKTADETASTAEEKKNPTKAGVVLQFVSEEEGTTAYGTWAVTAE